MCTLIALWKCHASAPLVLALNRDEYLQRPTAETALWDAGDRAGRIVSGRDLKSGGTWFGVGRHVVAALTNHRSSIPSKPGPKTRGELVVRALGAGSIGEVEADFSSIDASDYGDFHLLVADGKEMRWLTNRSGSIESLKVEPGAHVLGNYGLDHAEDPVVARVSDSLNGFESKDEGELGEYLKALLARSGPGWPLVRMDGYGTRNSAVLWWGRERPTLWTTEGAPDREPWRDSSHLLHELR